MVRDWINNHRGVFFIFALLVGVDLGLWGLAFWSTDAQSEALYFLDIGQGDSSLIVLPGGVKILIDAGADKAVLTNLARILLPTDRYIDVLVMTHPQLDHAGGFIDVLRTYRVGAFIGTGRKADSGFYQELRSELERRSVPYLDAREGDTLKIGEYQLSVLSPSVGELTSGEINDTSVVLLLKTPSYRALFTGDIGEYTERRLVAEHDVDIDVLKVAHHGSRFSTSEVFLKEATPAVAVIEVGKNTYGHPTPLVLERLRNSGSRIFRTDQEGLIKVVYQNEKLDVLGVE